MGARALVFHMSILCYKIFQLVPTFNPVTLSLEFDLFFETLTLLITFEQWLHFDISQKNSLTQYLSLGTNIFILWTWLWSFRSPSHSASNFLSVTARVIYFTWIILVIRSFVGNLPFDLDIWPILRNNNIIHKKIIGTCIRAFILQMCIYCDTVFVTVTLA